MKLHRIRDFNEWTSVRQKLAKSREEHFKYLDAITPVGRIPFDVPGYSYTAKKEVNFIVDYEHAGETGPIIWRERVCCPETYFNNRMRATFHLFDLEMEPFTEQKIYISEQLTPIYDYFKQHYPHTIGSEFLGDDVPKGKCRADGIRNEDLCNLSFEDSTFDAVISLDVFEHIPAYYDAFKECARILKPGGKLMWSVPFIPSERENSIRAKLIDGKIYHIIEPPEYHGDPLSPDGVLCFQHFGWEMLDEMRRSGFKDAYAVCYTSKEFGYLGGDQFMFFGQY